MCFRITNPITTYFLRSLRMIIRIIIINVIEAEKLIPYLVLETPEQSMRVLREETFTIERFVEKLKDPSEALYVRVSGNIGYQTY